MSCSTDWGSVSPRFAATDRAGRARVELVGVYAHTHPPAGHLGLLTRAAQRVRLATLPDAEAVQYAALRFDPEEIGLISRYHPPGTIVELVPDLPQRPIVARPVPQVATLTVHAKESGGSIVRGVGSIHVAIGLWISY